MAAVPVGVSHAEFRDATGSIEVPDGAVAGDTLLLFHSSDVGDIGDMGAPSGGPWALAASYDAGGLAGSNVWRKTMRAGDTSFEVTQNSEDSDGVAAILAVRGGDPAAIVAEATGFLFVASSLPTPELQPETASGLAIRYIAALAQTPGDVDWGITGLPGYTLQVDQQSNLFTTAALATKPLVSSEPLPQLDFTSNRPMSRFHAFTIVIPSGGGTGPPPTPPTFPAFTPTKGELWMRYTVHDTLTGEYRGDLPTVQGVTFGRRIGEATAWQGFVPLPNRKRGDQLAEIIPRDPTDLTTGPGRLLIHSWRGGVLWGIHWLHDALPARDDRGGVGVQINGSTLDGYLMRVYLNDTLGLSGDQLQIARDLISSMQATAGSNVGFALSAGTSGVIRDLTSTTVDNVTYGQLLQDFAKTDGGFEYAFNPTVVDGAIQRLITFGYPKISNTDAEHVFTEAQEGGDISSWREEISALRGGTRFAVIGGTPPADDATQDSQPVRSTLIDTPHLALGWPIIDQRITHPGASIDQQTVQDYAAYAAARAAGAPRVFSVDVVLGKSSTFHPGALGDWARFILNNPWHPPTDEGGASFNLRQRIIGWDLTPAERGNGKDKLTLITEQDQGVDA